MHKHEQFGSLLTAFLLAVALSCQSAVANEDVRLSPSVVLVLNLVSTDRVKPATGVVISNDGLVLVPSEFVTGAEEIIVLDDGADISRNGRPGKVLDQVPDTGLAILSVDGLMRPGITLSQSRDLYAEGMHFQAFPPAQQIAAGEPPLNVPMQTGETLPYLTGAILDGCGYLAGMTLAIGLQKPVPGNAPLIFDGDVLRDTFRSLQINVPRAPCTVLPSEPEEVKIQPPETQPDIAATESVQADVVDPEPAPSPGRPTDSIETGPQVTITPGPESSPNVIPWWARLTGLAVLSVLVLAILRRRKQVNTGVDPASDEPDTVQLSSGRSDTAPLPRSGHIDDGLPDLTDLPGGCNGLVVFEGPAADGREVRHFCAVDTGQFDLLIGRGEAGIRIEQASVSRRHARLQCNGGNMTLEDLGSSNGSHVNGVPCLPGEIMHLEPGSQVCFGDVCLSLGLLHRKESP